MASKEGSALGFTKFDGSDYSYWRMQMDDFLFNKKLHLPLGSKPEGMKVEEWNLLDRQVFGVDSFDYVKDVAYNGAKEKTIVGMMQALADICEKNSANNKVYLIKKLFNLKMSESSLVVKHLNSFNTVINQLVSVGRSSSMMRFAL